MKHLLFAFLTALLAVVPCRALENLTVGGTVRTMKVHVPADLPKGAPLVIACHGANQDAEWHDSHSKWSAVADTAKFVLVFPNGINHFWDISGNTDINFVLAIIDEMQKRHSIDTSRVYLTGFSMGGMFTYFCANRIPDRIAAFCPVSGYPMGDKSANSARPVPIFHTHGTGDDVCVFSGVQPTLDNWIKRNGCNPVAEVTKPYPASNPNSGATLHRWTGGLDGVEVVLLEFAGKGHWQSEDPLHAYTSVEAWNFMRRWSLGPDAPATVSIEPEDGSFDLPQSDLSISIEFNENVSAEGVVATLSGNSATCTLAAAAEGRSLRLTMPAGEKLPKGSYTLTVENVRGESGGTLRRLTASYVLGIEETGEQLAVETVLRPDWRSDQNKIGEGIPTGWYRLHSSADGRKDEKESGAANTGAARMKYFIPGGDFGEGFYLSARDFDKCEITYGRYPDRRLHLKPGKYDVGFNSIYWNEGSLNGKVTFDFTVADLEGRPVDIFPSLPSHGNLAENSGQTVTGSYAHSLQFEMKEEGDYTVSFSMTSGWTAVIVGNLKITTTASAADKYKGEFLRTFARATALYAALAPDALSSAEAVALKGVIDEYEGFVSTSPTKYTAATGRLLAAIEAVEKAQSGIGSVGADSPVVGTEYYDARGLRHPRPAKGVNIIRQRHADGSVRTIKSVYNR